MDTQPFANTTWTAYPKLLAGEDQSIKDYVEAASEARQCGRYREAHQIFSENLPDPGARPLLAFEYADLLTDQGLEGDRLMFLTRAASSLQSNATVDERLLVDLMLADARIWAEGHLHEAVTAARGIRNRMAVESINSLSDVQIRCIQLYHQIMKTGFQHSKWVAEEELTFFQKFGGNLISENTALSTALKEKGMHVAATKSMVELLSAAREESQAEILVQDILSYCDQLDTSQSLVLLTRSIQTRFEAIDRARDFQLTELAQQAQEGMLIKFNDLAKDSKIEPKAFAPKLSARFAHQQVCEQANPPEQIDGLEALADTFVAQRNYIMAHTTLINAVTLARNRATVTAEPNLPKRFQSLLGKLIDLHRNITQNIYFEVEALLQLLVLADLKMKPYEAILNEVSVFRRNSASFDIPTSLERLYSIAMNAARQTGQKSLLIQYEKDHHAAYTNCPMADTPVTLDQVTTRVQNGGKIALEYGINALQVAVSWADAEYARGGLSEEGWKELFGFYTPADLPTQLSVGFGDFLSYVRRDVKLLSTSYFKIPSDPNSQSSSRDQWKSRFNKLRLWLLDENPTIPRESRTFVLLTVAEGWGFSQRLSWLSGLSKVMDVNTLMQFMNEDNGMVVELQRLHQAETRTLATLPPDIEEKLNKIFQVGVDLDKIDGFIRDSEDVYQEYLKRNNQLGMYTAMMRQAELLWDKHRGGLVSADESVAALLRAELIFNEVRQSRSSPLAEHHSISGKLEQLHKFDAANLYHLGIHRSEISWRRTGDLLNQVETLARAAKSSSERSMADALEVFAKGLATKSTQRFANLVAWTQKSKSRALLDLLGIDSPIPPDLIEKCQQSPDATAMLQREQELVQEISVTTFPKTLDLRTELNSLRAAMRQTHVLRPIMAIRDGDTVELAQIEGILNQLPNDVVLVDFFKILSHGYLQAICYRKGSISGPLALLGMDWTAIETWVKQNLKSTGPRKEALAKLTPLLSTLLEKPRDSSGDLPIIRKHDTIVFCPTGILHRIPLHAIPIEDGVPLIANHPVVYCPSLSILRHCLQSVKEGSTDGGQLASKRLVLNPMPQNWENKAEKPVLSTPKIKALSERLGAEYLHCWDTVDKQAVMAALRGVGLFHYHGHVEFRRMDAPTSSRISSLQSFLRLGEKAGSPENHLMSQDIFACKLSKPALATIVGCQSHRGDVSPADDLLGIPMALYFAGATATVSSLWKLDDLDGAKWAEVFYGDLEKQRREAEGGKNVKLEGAGAGGEDSSIQNGMVNLALAMKKAIEKLRSDHNGLERDPYYWAGYVLSGSWMFPASRI